MIVVPGILVVTLVFLVGWWFGKSANEAKLQETVRLAAEGRVLEERTNTAIWKSHALRKDQIIDNLLAHIKGQVDSDPNAVVTALAELDKSLADASQ